MLDAGHVYRAEQDSHCDPSPPDASLMHSTGISQPQRMQFVPNMSNIGASSGLVLLSRHVCLSVFEQLYCCVARTMHKSDAIAALAVVSWFAARHASVSDPI